MYTQSIDDPFDTGFYTYDIARTAGTFPEGMTGYGTLINIEGTSSNFAMQILRSNMHIHTNKTIYGRFKTNGVWGNWTILIS